MMGNASRDDRNLIALDLLRFACAVTVVAYHLTSASVASRSMHGRVILDGLSLPRSALPWTWWGWLSVELFFVLSGYLVARAANGVSVGTFLRRRALRLLPAALICATASALVLALAGVEAPGRLAREWTISVLLLPMGPPIDGSYWTLPIEIAFYLLIAACLGRAGSARRIEAIGVALGSISLLTLFELPSGWSDGLLHIPIELALYGAEFSLGIVLAAGHRAPRRNLLRFVWSITLVLLTLATVHVHAAERMAAMKVGSTPLIPVAIAAIGLCVVALAPRLQPWLARSWVASHARTLGLISYPLYLVHQDAGAVMLASLIRRGVPFYLAAALSALAAGIFAWGVVRLGEPALRSALRAIGRTRAGGHGPEATTAHAPMALGLLTP